MSPGDFEAFCSAMNCLTTGYPGRWFVTEMTIPAYWEVLKPCPLQAVLMAFQDAPAKHRERPPTAGELLALAMAAERQLARAERDRIAALQPTPVGLLEPPPTPGTEQGRKIAQRVSEALSRTNGSMQAALRALIEALD